MIYLGMFLPYHSALGTHIEVLPPAERECRDYLRSKQFYERFCRHSVEVRTEPLSPIGFPRHRHTICDIPPEEWIGDDIAREVVKVLDGVPVNVSLVGDMVSELVDNFAQHAVGLSSNQTEPVFDGERNTVCQVCNLPSRSLRDSLYRCESV
jgi:hypothetical protein